MRPIDADKLHDVLCEHIKHNEEQGFSATEARLLLHMVDYTPTIEAEPTFEQIEKYCRKRCLVVVDGALFNEMKSRWSAEPRKHGHWVLDEHEMGHCSRCGVSHNVIMGLPQNYCPNCGAKMDEVEE